MTRTTSLMLVACLLWAGFAGQAAAAPSPIATSMGDLRWGMSENEIIAFVKRKIGEQYADQIKQTHDSRRQGQLRSDMKRAQAEVEHSVVRFEGRSSRWDSSPIAGEFAKDNGESMVIYKDASSENYYFFYNGHLWKWYKALSDSTFGGSNWKRFSQSIEKKFGRGHEKKGEMTPGQGPTQWIEFIDRNSRLRASDNTKNGVYGLVFEEMATVRELASTHKVSKSPSRSSYADADESDSSDSKSNGRTELAKASPKRSVFAADQRGESDDEYRDRTKRLAAEDRQRQQAMHSRKEEAKKGDVLQPLEGIDDKDPLGGL